MNIYYHQLDPFVIQFSESFGLRWYSLAYIIGAVCAFLAGLYLIRKGKLPLPKSKLSDIVFYGAMGAVIGGRLGYCLFYNPSSFLSFDSSFPFWGILKVHQGGMSSHGGIAGFLFSQILYAHRHNISFFSLMDLGAIPGSIGFFLGRIANFINGELYGRVVEGKVWLAVRFPTELYLWADHPGAYKKQLLSLKEILPSLSSVMPTSIRIPSVHSWEQWVSKAVEGNSIYENYIAHICGLIVQSANKSPIKEGLESLLSARHPSQIYQAVLDGLVPLTVVCFFWLKPRKAGLISLVWISCYLLCRIITEFYRRPDSQIGFEFLNLTRGQWLSVVLYIFVIIYGYIIYKKRPQGFGSF